MKIKLIGASLLLTTPLTTMADIAQEPLFLGSAVKPNIFFLVDDSGSMDWEVLKSNGALSISAYSGFPNSGNVDMTPTPDDRAEILESCVGYNVLYYDPNKTYEPWLGVDINGNTYADQVITGALVNPYDPSEGSIDLTRDDGYNGIPGYMEWTDDGDGVFEIDECPDPNRAGYNHNRDFVAASSAVGSSRIMTPAQTTNFANWYSYYRKREFIVKAALLNIAAESNARLGLATLHKNNNLGFEIQDMTVSTNREDLMAEIAEIQSNAGTPLRSRLNWVGQYFEGLAPSNLFHNVSAPQSPILPADQGGTCQQNFAVVMSDGYWNGGSPGVGNTDRDGSGRFDGGSYADGYSNTLADVAMHYYERDLAPDLANNVPTNPADENNAQHLVTYSVAFGVNGTLTESPSDANAAFAWPQPSSDSLTTIDDMRHAAWNGRGEFLNASDPTTLSSAFAETIASIEGRVSSSASVAANTTQMSTNSRIFQARFDSSNWSGQLLAFDLELATGKPNELLWDAAERMPNWNQRNVFTSNNNNGISFAWNSLTSAQQAQLNINPVNGVADGLGEDRVEYLLGVDDFEGSLFPSRKPNGDLGNLGDIVHSNPFFISPNAQFGYQTLVGEGASYVEFLTTKRAAGNPEMLYVGANDGMLHAIRADGTESDCSVGSGQCAGEELFAFVPTAIFNNLNELTQINGRHRYYVDGSAIVSDAYSDSSWRSVLVGTLGAGGKGLFALDVTDPENFGASDVIWDLEASDFTSTGGNTDLGYVLGEASLVRLANGSFGAVIGNGFDSDSGKAVLYIIPLDDPSAIIALDTGVGDTSNPNGLAAPLTIDTNGDRIADTVYAGDLQGNMWKFDISASNPDNWGVAYGGGTPAPLFRACQDTSCSVSQPISAKPQAVRHASGVIVTFGTGKYFETSDNLINSSRFDSFYAIYDNGTPVASRSNLLQQTITAELASTSGRNARVTSDNAIDFALHSGWYLDFRQASSPGERIVVEPVVRFGRVIFPTLVPNSNACSFGGTSWLMELDILSGKRLDKSVLDTNQDGVVNESDKVQVNDDEDPVVASGVQSQNNIIGRPAIIGNDEQEFKQFSGSTGNIETIAEDSEGRFGRQSWIQLR